MFVFVLDIIACVCESYFYLFFCEIFLFVYVLDSNNLSYIVDFVFVLESIHCVCVKFSYLNLCRMVLFVIVLALNNCV